MAEVLTIPELADRLKISERSAYRLCSRPDFPAVRVGALIRIPVDRLQEWIERQSEPLDAATG